MNGTIDPFGATLSRSFGHAFNTFSLPTSGPPLAALAIATLGIEVRLARTPQILRAVELMRGRRNAAIQCSARALAGSPAVFQIDWGKWCANMALVLTFFPSGGASPAFFVR
jgi:hypothetical protein